MLLDWDMTCLVRLTQPSVLQLGESYRSFTNVFPFTAQELNALTT